MPSSSEPTETSPLLGTESGAVGSNPIPVSVQDGAIVDPSESGADLERRDSINESRAAQFAGNAEIRKKLKYIVPTVSIGVFLSAADQTIIVSSYGKIGSDLNALNLTSWIATSYFLTLTSFQPLYGKLSDIFGRKACLLYAYAIFGLGCLCCGLSQNMNQLIAARVVQGIGGGGMSTVVSILFSDIVPLKDRGVWQGLINIVFAAGAGSGAPLGGLLADSIGWRWGFIAQAPICLVAFIAVILVLDLPPQEQQNWKKKFRRIDFGGAAILVGAVFGLIFGMDRGSNQSWSSPISYGPLAASVVLFGLCIFYETKIAVEPFAPGHIIFERSMFASYLCNFFSIAGWLAVLYYIPLFYQAVDGYSATQAAVRMLPAIFASVLGSLFGGFMMKKTGKYYWLTVIAYLMLVAGMIPILLFSGLIRNNTYGISIGMVVGGFGNGIGITSSLIALISNAEPNDQAIATACSYLFRSLGSVIGISLSATVIQQQLRRSLKQRLGNGKDAAKIEHGVRQSLEYLKTLQPAEQKLVRNSYEEAVRYGFALMMVLTVGAALASFFIREKRLSR